MIAPSFLFCFAWERWWETMVRLKKWKLWWDTVVGYGARFKSGIVCWLQKVEMRKQANIPLGIWTMVALSLGGSGGSGSKSGNVRNLDDGGSFPWSVGFKKWKP